MQEHAELQQKSAFFQVGTEKMIELTLCTFGLYGLFWTYRNWAVLQRRGEHVNPLLRTLLSPFFQYDLYRRVHQRAVLEGVRPRWTPVRLYVLFLAFSLIPVWMLISHTPWGWLVSLLPLLPNALVNISINDIHDRHVRFFALNTDLSGLNWAAIVAGLVGWLTLLIVAMAYH